MKVLTKGIYYAKEKDKEGKDKPLRLWHNCEKYRGRDFTRIELVVGEEQENPDDAVQFFCPTAGCEFDYELDKHLNIS